MNDIPNVIFERPDWNSLSDSGLACADMHFHTHYSDSYTSVRTAVKLAKRRNVGLAITDHNLITGAAEALSEKSDVMVIPGIEISSWDGPHILVYFYDFDTLGEYWTNNIRPHMSRSPWLAIDKDTKWILDSLENVNCVISAAHPLGYLFFNKGVQKCINKGYLDPSVVEGLDAYEVICSGMSRQENIKAARAATEFGLGFTGGTDGHILTELGNVVTASDAKDADEFLDNIKKKRTSVIGKEKTPPMKVAMGTASMSRFFRYLPSSLALHYRQDLGKDSAYRKK
jgi:predicted metal-dependent phosphoesterase TrpH